MPISAEEGLKLVNSKNLVDHEKQWFEKLCLLTDHLIKSRFDGKYFNLSLDRAWVKMNGREVNCGPMCYHLGGDKKLLLKFGWRLMRNWVGG